MSIGVWRSTPVALWLGTLNLGLSGYHGFFSLIIPHLTCPQNSLLTKLCMGGTLPHLALLGRGHSPVDSLEEMLLERDAILDELQKGEMSLLKWETKFT